MVFPTITHLTGLQEFTTELGVSAGVSFICFYSWSSHEESRKHWEPLAQNIFYTTKDIYVKYQLYHVEGRRICTRSSQSLTWDLWHGCPLSFPNTTVFFMPDDPKNPKIL
jgi:hypothetical protein